MTYSTDALRWAIDEFDESEPWSYEYTYGGETRIRSGVDTFRGFSGILELHLNDEERKKYDIPGIGTMKIVEDERNGEGGGDYAAIIFEIVAEDGSTRLFKKEGYYASYDGYTWDGDLYEVRPASKLITVYERV
ncbi:hypothetical protein ACFU44_00595 [Nocardia rhizosphaerihabitans]|uniref:hypothetical protein n=1 Tax=Nocardia rhizosphaerihabitans TaxID=1691570 RepID=UPI0036713F1F